MKKIVTAIIIALTLGASLAYANEAKHFVLAKTSQYIGGIIGDTVVYIYPNSDASNGLTTNSKLKILTSYAAKTICGNKDSRKLVTDLDMNVFYIYPSKDFKSVLMITIDNCDRYVPSEKTKK